MKAILNLFTWLASGIIEGLSPGGTVSDTIAAELKRYRESATQLGEQMQKAWEESLRTLSAAMGGAGWIIPKSRKQFAEKFIKEVITPFAVKNGLAGEKLDAFMKKCNEQCQELIELKDELINFTSFDEKVLLDALAQTNSASTEEMGFFLMDRIQIRLPNAKELIQLLWYRNLLLEGLVAHFHFMLMHNSGLAELVARRDRERIQQDLGEIKSKVQDALKGNELVDMANLGSRATQLATADELYKIQKDYQSLFGSLFDQISNLNEGQQEIKGKLDQIISLIHELDQIHQNKIGNSCISPEIAASRPRAQEIKLAEKLHTFVKNVGWKLLPVSQQALAVNSLAVSLYGSQKMRQALSLLEEAVQNDLRTPEIYFNQFQVLQAAGRDAEAVDAYNKAVSGNPKLALFPPDRYEMKGIIGRGGMGVVYKAHWLERNIPVAIKVLLLPEEWYPGARNRFLQSAKASITLKHTNIVLIYEFKCDECQSPYVAMEYLEGMDLERRVKVHGRFGLEEGLTIARGIAEGIAYAHQAGVIHRDLKPGNVVLTPKGPKIIDFGLAKWEKDSTLTVAEENFYTLYYSSPEQRANFHGVDKRSDIYSFGKTLYYIFTGEEPYDIDWEEVPFIIRPILQKATRKRLEHRYENMEQVIEALDKAGEGKLIIDMNNGYDNQETGEYPIIEVIRDGCAARPPDDLVERLPSDCVIQEQGTIIANKDEAPMVYVPAGTFFMGDDSDKADYDEGPIHEVDLDAYMIDVYPVTNKQYKMFLDALENLGDKPCPWCHPDAPKNKVHIPQFWYNDKWNMAMYPVVGVDWWDAYAYCKWAGKDIPTEAEWEKAARGVDGRIYPWGNEIPTPDICNYGKIYKMTTPVNKFPADRSPYGCSNMAGNVWEWCYDWFDPTYYKYSPTENPTGPTTGQCRVGRGGSWMNDPKKVRTTTRGSGTGPGDRNHHLGFRTIKRLKK